MFSLIEEDLHRIHIRQRFFVFFGLFVCLFFLPQYLKQTQNQENKVKGSQLERELKL